MQLIKAANKNKPGIQYAITFVLSCSLIWTPIIRIGKESMDRLRSDEPRLMSFALYEIAWEGYADTSDLTVLN
jgi:hypothetical protein